MAPWARRSRRPRRSISLSSGTLESSKRYRSAWRSSPLSIRYSCTSEKVGLVKEARAGRPSPRAMARAKNVFPLPSAPTSRTRSAPRRLLAIRSPSCVVSRRDASARSKITERSESNEGAQSAPPEDEGCGARGIIDVARDFELHVLPHAERHEGRPQRKEARRLVAGERDERPKLRLRTREEAKARHDRNGPPGPGFGAQRFRPKDRATQVGAELEPRNGGERIGEGTAQRSRGRGADGVRRTADRGHDPGVEAERPWLVLGIR